jgi:pSer/pThr/pTyr-binding forkhead associated (FHA) protein
VVYSDQRRPIHYHSLSQDVTRIGRTDAVRGEFADLDISRLFDEATARRVSRKHAVVLRSRETQTYVLRPLAGNTGTQIETEVASGLRDYPLTDGMRIVLGGTVRIKFEVIR